MPTTTPVHSANRSGQTHSSDSADGATTDDLAGLSTHLKRTLLQLGMFGATSAGMQSASLTASALKGPATPAGAIPDPFAVKDPNAAADSGDAGTTPEVPTDTTLPDDTHLLFWTSGSTRRELPGGVTVDHSPSLGGLVAVPGASAGTTTSGGTIVTLGDKTTIQTDGTGSSTAGASDWQSTLLGAGTTPGAQPNGNGALITLADGTRIRSTATDVEVTKAGSSTPEIVKKGSSVAVDGYTVTANPAGGSTVTAPDGTAVETDTHGMATTTLGGTQGPKIAGDGSVTTTAADQSEQTLGPDGSVVAQGTYTTTVDGSSTVSFSNGNTRRTLPGGAVVESTPAEGNRVKTTLSDGVTVDTVDTPPDPSAAQIDPITGQPSATQSGTAATAAQTRSTTVTLSDGTTVKFGAKGVTFTNAEGMSDAVTPGAAAKQIPGPDGATISMNGAGTATLHFADGRNVVVDPNGDPRTTLSPTKTGQTVAIEGDGSTMISQGADAMVYDAQGNVQASGRVVTAADGSVTNVFSNGYVTRTFIDKTGGQLVISKNSDEGYAEVKTPSGADFAMGASGLAATLPNGAKLSTDSQGVLSYTSPEGTVSTIAPGSPTRTLSDGTTIALSNTAELAVTLPDGTHMNCAADGVLTTTLPDKRIVNADGTITTMAKDGTETINDLDPSVTKPIDQSTMSAPDANGVRTETWASNPDKKVEHGPHADITTDGATNSKTIFLPSTNTTIKSTMDNSSYQLVFADGSMMSYDTTDSPPGWIYTSSAGVATPVISGDDAPVTIGTGDQYDVDGKGNLNVTLSDGTSVYTTPTYLSTIENDHKHFKIDSGGAYTRP